MNLSDNVLFSLYKYNISNIHFYSFYFILKNPLLSFSEGEYPLLIVTKRSRPSVYY